MGESDDRLRMPEIAGRRTIYQGKRMDVEVLTVRMANGRVSEREVIRHPGAVVILPLTDDGRVVLIRNVRTAVGQVLLELPAGTRDKGESPELCAARELAEETGYRAARIEPLVDFFASPGVIDERLYAFVATGLTAGPTSLEAGEQIVTELVAYDDAIRMCVDGTICDGKTMVTLLAHHVRTRGGPTR